MNAYEELFRALKSGRKSMLLTLWPEDGEERGEPAKICCAQEELERAESRVFSELGAILPEESVRTLCESARQAVSAGVSYLPLPGFGAALIEPFFPEPSLLILGGGHIAKPLAEQGAAVGFAVTVVDDRPYFANHARFPSAVRIVCDSFGPALDKLAPNESSYVVIVTRGERYDLECLRKLRSKGCAYIGMIGSECRAAGVMRRLAEEGYPEAELKKVRTPIGLEIGAVTPEEISVAILAQAISYRRLEKPELGKNSPVRNCPEYNREALYDLAHADSEPKALATILSTWGPTPRNAGAKMLFCADGGYHGSIGGGSGEAAIMEKARDIMWSGGYCIEEVELLAELCDEAGVACGGKIRVLVEAVS